MLHCGAFESLSNNIGGLGNVKLKSRLIYTDYIDRLSGFNTICIHMYYYTSVFKKIKIAKVAFGKYNLHV